MLKSLGIKEPGDYMIDPLKIKNNFHVYSATAVTKRHLHKTEWFDSTTGAMNPKILIQDSVSQLSSAGIIICPAQCDRLRVI